MRAQSITAPCPTPPLGDGRWTVRKNSTEPPQELLPTKPKDWFLSWFSFLTLRVHPELPEEYQQVGRQYFARSPGSDIWVWFGDLPDATHTALWEKHKSKLAFSAGLERLWM